MPTQLPSCATPCQTSRKALSSCGEAPCSERSGGPAAGWSYVLMCLPAGLPACLPLLLAARAPPLPIVREAAMFSCARNGWLKLEMPLLKPHAYLTAHTAQTTYMPTPMPVRVLI